jgi:hypothetical protein
MTMAMKKKAAPQAGAPMQMRQQRSTMRQAQPMQPVRGYKCGGKIGAKRGR